MNSFPNIHCKKKIGLLGGSFDPPHQGHLNISNISEKRLGLDKMIWLVSIQNPLKNKKPETLKKRMLFCQNIVSDQGILISDIESKINTKYTKDFLKNLLCTNPKNKFVWIMGSDNFCNLDKWRDWTWIIENIPIAVISRPGTNIKVLFSKAAIKYKKFRIKEKNSKNLIFHSSPAWVLLNGIKNYNSSSKIREMNKNDSLY